MSRGERKKKNSRKNRWLPGGRDNSFLFLTFPDAANAGEFKRFYSSKLTDCLREAGDVGRLGTEGVPGVAALARAARLG